MKVIIMLFLVLSGLSSEASIKDRLKGFLVGGHRGGTYSLSNNTLEQFQDALDKKADILEMDLRLSKDGHPIVYHDSELHGSSNCSGIIEDLTLIEIKNCNFNHGHKIPSFKEVLVWSAGRIILNAEFKTLEVIVPAISLLQEYKAYDWVYFQANDKKHFYEAARNFDKSVPLLYAPNSLEELKWSLDLKDDYLVIIEFHENIRNSANIKSVHDAGKLASENSWHFSNNREFFGAKCKDVYKNKIDIAITERVESCVKQKNSGLVF